jgi:hypothetical protein
MQDQCTTASFACLLSKREHSPGCFAPSVRRSSRWSVRAPCRPPAWGFAALLPLLRHRCQSFSTNEPLTHKRLAIAYCVPGPASSAWMIRSRRS